MTPTSAGTMLREWRTTRNRSQMDVALDAAVSPRHLSFVENGRSKASPEVIVSLCDVLDVPLRHRNSILLAAGYAPRYSHEPLDSARMEHARGALRRMIDAHDPYPGVVVDRQWDVVLANSAALGLLDGVPGHVLEPSVNIYRLSLHPDGLARRTTNLTEWAHHLLAQLRRSIQVTGDPTLVALLDEVQAYPDVAALPPRLPGDTDPPLLLPVRLDSPHGELSLFTTLTTFGTPLDVTLDELAVELFYPADERTDAVLRESARGGP
jgi:transcriptional regulator with XRE-family HTH domain